MICRMFRMAGDVWGEYNQEGIRFTLLTREKVGRYQVCPFLSVNMIYWSYCSSKGSGRHFCRVWRKGIVGLGLTWLRWVFMKIPGIWNWDFCSRMQWWQLWAHSSSRRLSLIHQRLRWEELKTILANNSPPRRVLVGQPFAATWRGTWPQQMKTRSSMTWLSRPGYTKPCYPPESEPEALYRDGTQLPAHKLVLASQTSYFEGLFRQENPDQVGAETNNKM